MSQEWERMKAIRRDRGMGGVGPGSPGGPGRPGFRALEKPKSPWKTVRRLLAYLSGFRTGLATAILLSIISSLAGIAGTWFLKPLINGLTAGTDLAGLVKGILQMALVYVLAVVTSYASSLMMMHFAQRAVFHLRKALFAHLQDLPLRFFDSKTHGELMSRFTNDMDNVHMALEQSLSQTITSLLTLVGVFIIMLTISPLLTILVVIMLAVMIVVTKIIGSRSARYFKQQQKALGEMNGLIEETMIGQKVVKVFNHEASTLADFGQKNEGLRRTATNAQSFAGVLMPVMGNLNYVLYALIAMGGAILTIRGQFDIGSLAVFLQYARSFSQPVAGIANQFNMLLAALAGAERIFDVMDQPPEEDAGHVTMVRAIAGTDGRLAETANSGNGASGAAWAWKIPKPDGLAELRPLRGDIRFQSVTFGYLPEKGVLKEITLFAKPGQKIAFVGSTGAGKTTITNLINRFYDISGGEITYDGIKISEIRKSDLRRAMGMVLQDVHLFEGTIRDNIRYGKLDATDEEIVRAAELANAHTFITRLPDGYDTMLTQDGANLSQGQRQLLSIARAAVADPPVLILDEATSSVDTRTEKLIEKGMDQLMRGRTTLAIAHRLSTVRNANAIMVLENGEIIERGDHLGLIDQRGRYYQLYAGISELS